MKKFTKRITASLLVVCMLIMGSASAFAYSANLYGASGNISCALVDSNREYDGYTATGRITFNSAHRWVPVHYTLKMSYYDDASDTTILVNQADFTYTSPVSELSMDMEAKVPSGYSNSGTWHFEATWDDGNDFVGADDIYWDTNDTSNTLHDDSSARQFLLIYPDGKLPWEY